MQHTTWIVCLAAALTSFSHGADAQSDSAWDVVLNGRAVHMNAADDWNEENWGLGLEREFASTGPWIKVALANAFDGQHGQPVLHGGRRPQAALPHSVPTISTSTSAASRSS